MGVRGDAAPALYISAAYENAPKSKLTGGVRAGKMMKEEGWTEGMGMTDADRCRDAYRVMCRAMIDKDADALRAVLDDGFVLVHMTGLRQSRNEFIRAVTDGTLNYFSCYDDALDVEVHGDTATLTGKSRVEAAVFGGGKHTWRLRQRMTLARCGEIWKITMSTAGTY